MIPVDEPPPPRRTPEAKIAVAALGLVSLQEAHEAALFRAGSRALGRATLGAGGALLLALALGILIGLCHRNRLAWWLGILAIGGLGVALLTASWPLIQPGLPGPERVTVRRVAPGVFDGGYEWRMPMLNRFQALWLIAKITLLLAVPLTLLTGALRERLRGR